MCRVASPDIITGQCLALLTSALSVSTTESKARGPTVRFTLTRHLIYADMR